jgi:glycine/D-amino acid oxidase-like deaminating enzyme
MRTRHIGIIGAGIAGLHLGLRLQRLGIACTIITDKTPDQVAAAQLANMVVHWPTTLGREGSSGSITGRPRRMGSACCTTGSRRRSRSISTATRRNPHAR